MFALGHLSDLHVTPVRPGGPRDLANKRFFGWLSWQLRRRRIHRPEVLAALIHDLRAQAPDHLVVTGDLTNLALPDEFSAARLWLERLGPPEGVSVVPGNHDAYVPVPHQHSWHHWVDYWSADEPGPVDPLGDPRSHFPAVRVRGGLAVVGVCSAVPTPALQATGELGAEQIERLEKTLAELADTGLCRVVAIHHPVTADATHPRRALRDAQALRELLARVGAELVLHGHNHRTLVDAVPGPAGAIPVVGVRSSTDRGERTEKRAQYHLYAIEPEAPGGFRITLHTRGYDPARGTFRAEGEPSVLGEAGHGSPASV